MCDLEIFCARCSKRKSRKRHALEMQSYTFRHEKSSYISFATGGGERVSWAENRFRATLPSSSGRAGGHLTPACRTRPCPQPPAEGDGAALGQRPRAAGQGDTETSRARPAPAPGYATGAAARNQGNEPRGGALQRGHSCPGTRPCWTQDTQGRARQSCQGQRFPREKYSYCRSNLVFPPAGLSSHGAAMGREKMSFFSYSYIIKKISGNASIRESRWLR